MHAGPMRFNYHHKDESSKEKRNCGDIIYATQYRSESYSNIRSDREYADVFLLTPPSEDTPEY